MEQKKFLIIAFLVLVVGVGAGYLFGQKSGYSGGYAKGDETGYARAQADVKKLEEEAAKKAAAEVTKAANPFQVSNPLEGVESNPFQKAKKVLNPFQ